jgi:DNA-binding ferritin-like protein
MALRKTAKRGAAKRKMKVRKNRTMRAGIDNKKKSLIVRTFFEMLNTVKLYHWKTRTFSQHNATDELYKRLNENVDKFVEVLLGKDESRIKMVERRCELLDFSKGSDFKERIYEYREFLVDMNRYFDAKRDTDLLNIRDEILGDINQFLYLMTFR